jgi:hypothetical protein
MRARLLVIASLPLLLAAPAAAQSENARVLEKQCSAGKIASCTNLAVLYKNGRGVKRDSVRALTLFLKSCERGVNYACGNVGEMTYLGQGIRANAKNGETLIKGACRRGDAWSCETARRYGFKMLKRAPA